MKLNLLLLSFFITPICIAQTFFPSHNYPSHSFRNPLNIPISLVGNFGECRPNHFHSGIDIRTNGKENYEVYAIDDGFISRIKIEAGGFGNAIYITHLNGYTSLYAHLNKFYPELESYVRRKQYESKSWQQDFILPPHVFPVRKGKMIAWSGNTGSSSGPHLHMEIRDTKTEAPLNGLLFYDVIKDNKAPVIKQLAIYDGNKSVYEQKPSLVKVNKVGTSFKLANETVTINSSKAFLGIGADDYMEIATGTLGIYEMRLFVDDKALIAWQMDDISYDITRYMNAHADYKMKKDGARWIQFCGKLPNDNLPIYKQFSQSNGNIDLSDGEAKKIRIEVYDVTGNKSSISFFLKGNSTTNPINCETKFTQGKPNQFKNNYISLDLKEDALYDDICFKTSIKNSTNPYSHIYQVHTSNIPVHSYFDLKLTPKTNIPSSLADKIAVQRYPYGNEKNKKGKAAKLQHGIVIVSVRDFGNYEIVIDKTAPKISCSIKNGDNISALKRFNFVIVDETTSVSNVEATLDGQWLRIVQKGNNFYYEMDNYFPKGTHTLAISATDENKNTNTQTYTLTR